MELTLRLRNVSSVTEATAVAAELDAGGHVSHVASADAAHDAMVGAWFERVGCGERVALVVATNDDADAISEAIQQRRLDAGELRLDAVALERSAPITRPSMRTSPTRRECTASKARR